MHFQEWVVYKPNADGCPILYVTDSKEEAEQMARLLGGRVMLLAEWEARE